MNSRHYLEYLMLQYIKPKSEVTMQPSALKIVMYGFLFLFFAVVISQVIYSFVCWDWRLLPLSEFSMDARFFILIFAFIGFLVGLQFGILKHG